MRRALPILLLLVVASGAYFAFAGRGEPESEHTAKPISAWIDQLDGEDVEKRYQAGLMLAAYGERAVPALIERLRRDVEKPPTERGDPDAEGEPRSIAADTLVMIGRPAVDPLIGMLEVEAHYERALSQQALVAIGITEAELPALVRLIDHGNAITAGMAAHLIGTLDGAQEALLRVVEENADDETSVHRALLTLASLEGDAPATMTPFLGHPSPIVRREALHVLGLVGPRGEQADALAALLGDPDEHVRSWAATVLRRMKGEARTALAAVARDAQGTPAQLAISLLGEQGADALAVVPVLRARLDDPTPIVRAAAAEAVFAITRVEDETLPVLVEVMQGRDRDARILAMAALGGFEESGERLAPLLAPALEDPDREIARVAAISLGNLGPGAKAAIDALEKAAGSEHEALARAAAMALDLVRSPGG